MKKYFTILVAAVVFCINYSCKEEITAPSTSEKILGAWVFQGYDNKEPNLSVFQRSAGLDSNNGGYIFYKEGRLLERKNAGWCGTPPISYANFSGTWEFLPDSAVKINVAYWGGRTEYNLKIISLDRHVFKVIYLYPL